MAEYGNDHTYFLNPRCSEKHTWYLAIEMRKLEIQKFLLKRL